MSILHHFRIAALTAGIFLAATSASWADAASSIAAGRQALKNKNLSGALTQFNAAVTADAANPEANLLLGLARLASQVDRPETQALLTKMGVPKVGRSLFQWTADLNQKFPAALTSDDFELYAKTVAVPALEAADANLAKVTDPSFQTPLSQIETGLPDVIIDYGDVLFMRSLLAEFKSSILVADAFESKAKIADLVAWRRNNMLTVQKILKTYPKLLDLQTSASVLPAVQRFSDAVTLYVQAAMFIRNRADNTDRLFVLDPEFDVEEAELRAQLVAVQQSINSATAFDQRTTVFAGAYANAPKSLRILLPAFDFNDAKPGANFDFTFGGVLPGLTQARVGEYAGKLGDYLDERLHFRRDPKPPTLALKTPKNHAKFTVSGDAADATVTFGGKAADNVGVTRVEVKVDNEVFSAQGTTAWSLTLQLPPKDSAYAVEVRSFDAQGNASKPALLSLTVAQLFPIVLTAPVNGTVTPMPKAGQLFEAYRPYTFVAKPKPGFLFRKWKVSSASNDYEENTLALSIYLFEPTTIEATFAPNPFGPFAGKANGLLTDNTYDPETGDLISSILRGAFSLNVTKTGSFTGKLLLGREAKSFKGQLSADGIAEIEIPRTGKGSIFLYIDQTPDADGFTYLSVFDGESELSSTSFTQRVIPPTDFAAQYTVSLASDFSDPAAPVGSGYLTLVRAKSGAYRVVGKLADGSKVSTSASLTPELILPLYVQIDKFGSTIGGGLFFDSFTALPANLGNPASTNDAIAGELTWSHPANPKAAVFKSGFQVTVLATGSIFTPALSGQRVAPFTGGQNSSFLAEILNSMGDLVTLGASQFTVGTDNKVALVSPNPALQLTLKLNVKAGLFTGSFSEGSPAKKHSFEGALLQQQATGAGFFADPAQQGLITITP